jgi:hypothetical protein
VNSVPEATRPADGVLVISAWEDGVAGHLLARCTMTSGVADDESVTKVVGSVADLHALIDSWIDSLTR